MLLIIGGPLYKNNVIPYESYIISYLFMPSVLLALSIMYFVFSVVLKIIRIKRKRVGKVNFKKATYNEEYVKNAMITPEYCVYWMDKEDREKLYPLAVFLNENAGRYVAITADKKTFVTKADYKFFGNKNNKLTIWFEKTMPIDSFDENLYENNHSIPDLIGQKTLNSDHNITGFEVYDKEENFKKILRNKIAKS